MKIELRDDKAIIQSDDGKGLFEIVLSDSGEPALTVLNVASGFRMNGVRYGGALTVRPNSNNSVELVSSRHPNQPGSDKLPDLQ